MVKCSSSALTVCGILFGMTLTGGTAATVASTGDDKPKPAPQKVSATIAEVAWIAGHWGTSFDGNLLEETWSQPGGDCMMGMFRWLKEGKVWIYELLSIGQESGTLVLRFRHFGSDLTAWEPKTEPLTYQLASLGRREVVFENPQSESHRRFEFSRPDDETLVVRVGAFRDGKIEYSEFRYQRRK